MDPASGMGSMRRVAADARPAGVNTLEVAGLSGAGQGGRPAAKNAQQQRSAQRPLNLLRPTPSRAPGQCCRAALRGTGAADTTSVLAEWESCKHRGAPSATSTCSRAIIVPTPSPTPHPPRQCCCSHLSLCQAQGGSHPPRAIAAGYPAWQPHGCWSGVGSAASAVASGWARCLSGQAPGLPHWS